MSGGDEQSAWARQEYYTIGARFPRSDVRPPRMKSRLRGTSLFVYIAVLNRAYTPVRRPAPL